MGVKVIYAAVSKFVFTMAFLHYGLLLAYANNRHRHFV